MNSSFIIIPLEKLKKAEEVFPEISEIIGPYLESIINEGDPIRSFSFFYDDVGSILERTRGTDSISQVDSDVFMINDFEKISDDIFVALEYVKHDLDYFLPKGLNKVNIESEKIDDQSIILKISDEI